MFTLGINLGSTAFGKALKDGGACLMYDGDVIAAIAEERLTRTKAAGGYERAIPYVLDAAGITSRDIDLTVMSTCCEPMLDEARLQSLSQPLGFKRTIAMPSHHLSHAYSAFYPSPFDRAIIVVADGGGNVLSHIPTQDPRWWRFPREQHSYYLGEGDTIQELGRDFSEPFEAGLGEVYRAFTYYLGWHSSRHAGKLMALASYGDIHRVPGDALFSMAGERLRSIFSNEPNNPLQMIERDYNLVKRGLLPRQVNAPIEQSHRDIACHVQAQTQEAMVRLVQRLVLQTGCRNLCLAGGVALNCVMNNFVRERAGIDAVFVQPAANDQGQCLGNALYGQHQLGYKRQPQERFPVYLGRTYKVSGEELQHLVRGVPSVDVAHVRNPAAIAAQLIGKSAIVAWFQGGAEFGPRALGHRSILAHPGDRGILPQLYKIKSRDSFMPFAPAILEEEAADYFELAQPSPYMLLAPYIRTDKRKLISAVTHVDGTARVQTVGSRDDRRFRELLWYMKRNIGVPAVLNTSFNRESEPIVETPEDAIKCFLSCEIDALVIEDYVLIKKFVHE